MRGDNSDPNHTPLSRPINDERDVNQLITQINIKLLSPPRRGTWDYADIRLFGLVRKVRDYLREEVSLELGCEVVVLKERRGGWFGE